MKLTTSHTHVAFNSVSHLLQELRLVNKRHFNTNRSALIRANKVARNIVNSVLENATNSNLNEAHQPYVMIADIITTNPEDVNNMVSEEDCKGIGHIKIDFNQKSPYILEVLEFIW